MRYYKLFVNNICIGVWTDAQAFQEVLDLRKDLQYCREYEIDGTVHVHLLDIDIW